MKIVNLVVILALEGCMCGCGGGATLRAAAAGTLAGTTTTLTASPTSVSSGASVTFTAKVALPRAAEPPSMDLLGAIPSKKAAHQFFSARATLQEIREARISCGAWWDHGLHAAFREESRTSLLWTSGALQ